MKFKKQLTVLVLFVSVFCFGQTLDCEKDIKALSDSFNVYNNFLKVNKIKIDSLKINITTTSLKKIDSIYKKSCLYSKKLDSIYKKFSSYKMVCLDLKMKEKLIDSLFKHTEPKLCDQQFEEKTAETQTYLYFNENQIIKEDVIDKTTTQGRVLSEVLSNTNEKSYFGDITIPKENEEFYFLYKPKKRNSKKDSTLVDSDKKYTFKKLELEVKDGVFTSIRVTVGYNGNMHTFENNTAVSFMYFSTRAKDNILFYKQSIVNNKAGKNNKLGSLFIRLSDVMNYNYKMGNHFIPSDLTLELPKNTNDNVATNKNGPATYQIKQETYLDKIVEFRTYTDFLSLFGEENNGLVSVEANAKFYIFPYPRQLFDWQAYWELLPSITTNVTYNRFEEGSKIVQIPATNFKNDLDLIEKRFLTLGGNLNVFQFKHKNFPVKATVFGTANYQLTQVNADSVLQNAKAFSYGFGLNLSAKRFNNFGFNINGDISWYDYKNSNTLDILNKKIPVLKAQAEIFYHPTKSPNQAIFARLTTYNYMGTENDQAFYQFQFGYKFSIGSRTVKK